MSSDEHSISPPGLNGSGSGEGERPSSLSPSQLQQQQQQQQHVKRSRVLLSCGACRASKLKCDRGEPCGQCLKKGKPEGCAYAPRPAKQKPAKSMAARLKRLEGMVREMIVPEGGPGADKAAAAAQQQQVAVDSPAHATVVQGQKATSFVGGTHFMAILEDIEDLKNYFEYPEDDEEDNQNPYETLGSPGTVLMDKSMPRNKDELLSLLPEKSVVDRLLMRYFNSNSPSQHILHRPTFSKEYGKFWQDPSKAELSWIALLFMIVALGVFFSSFQAPHELKGDSPIAAIDRVRHYRNAAGWALVWSKYAQPDQVTLQAFLLYVEGDFLFNRHSQMECYLLASVCIRLMLKMGLHRDPSKLPHISPYDGEMRRRLWNLAIQIDLLVAFHLGLPSMIHGIESDTLLPRNLLDSDFDEDTKELPLPRPSSDYTPLTYPIFKASLCRCFGLVARQAHSLTVPSYAEVMKLDNVLEETWKQVPPFMKVKPLDEAITDPPMQVIQRFGLAAIYQKSRCVLHRRYITDAIQRNEHAYSRKACLDAALQLLDYQNSMFEACKPGAMLAQNGWFTSSLAINDFLMGDMIVALVVQDEKYSEVGGDFNWMTQGTPLPSKDELRQVLRRSFYIWIQMAKDVPDCQKAADVVATILKRCNLSPGTPAPDTTAYDASASGATSDEHRSMAGLTVDGSGSSATMDYTDGNLASGMDFGAMGGDVQMDQAWMGISPGYDWNQFDAITRSNADAIQTAAQSQDWLNSNPLDDLDFLTSNSWNVAPGTGGS